MRDDGYGSPNREVFEPDKVEIDPGNFVGTISDPVVHDYEPGFLCSKGLVVADIFVNLAQCAAFSPGPTNQAVDIKM